MKRQQNVIYISKTFKKHDAFIKQKQNVSTEAQEIHKRIVKSVLHEINVS